ncbi:ABC transporter permease [Desulfuromonas carbonis]|uniref:ABC transporter permease n=1 Tax=Desulfuromonas sp. DDH964 TaxID=1823759 RepID=UPI00078CC062|nr:FtsX-like permease family protein [Desulfuromonas sp. DDH964]AMV72810.1 ABC transporter membrane protein [Desulfuromonas sp. DDH964]
MDLLQLAWKNLWRNPRRTLITLAALSFSLMLVQAFHNLSFGVYAGMIDSGVRAGSGHIAIYRGNYAASRNEKLSFPAAQLPTTTAALPAVLQALPRVYLPGLAQSSRESRGILLTGVDPELEMAINPFLRHLGNEEMLRADNSRDALVGERLLHELKLQPGNKFVITVQNRDGELASELFRVRGVVQSGIREVDRSLVMVDRRRAAAMAGIPGEIHELALVLRGTGDEAATLPQVAALVADRPELRALGWQEAMPNLSNAIRLDYASQKFIFVVILLIVTIGVVNTLLMSVLERIREFGVILAVGATPGRLRRMILAEALILGLAALLLGSLLGSLATWYLVTVGIDLRTFLPENLEFGGVVFDPILRATWDIAWMVRIALYVLALALLASLYPAVKAARIRPVEAMRHF